ncbi:hypothetical protein PHMEG_00024017 [Phytophthora megakarya]|uniref:Uncharacterized protein n=1 Tax=Phytophthora megakarya TaxID=4795 RepID=A0A225VG86_9STRA|nr:hypothetical protein PHMEG_00024017 [Phytophthora megakarya]
MFAAVEIMEPIIVDELRDQLFLRADLRRRDGRMTADEHICFLDLVVDQYHVDVRNLVGVVCDNMETYKAIS